MTQDAGRTVIRRATVEDAPKIALALRLAFAEYEALYTREGYAATTPDAGQVRIRIHEGPVWVALYDGRIVGTASVVQKPAGLYIRGMAVVPTARGLGIGQLLLAKIEASAVAARCQQLFLSTTPFLNRAIRLYESFGFQRMSDGPRDLFGTPLFSMQKILSRDKLKS